jgi:hypothetical protein
MRTEVAPSEYAGACRDKPQNKDTDGPPAVSAQSTFWGGFFGIGGDAHGDIKPHG